MVLSHILDGVRRAYDLGWTVLSFRRPQSQACEETTVWDFELEEGICHVAAVSFSS